jgi:hypothetical protein
MQLTGVHQSERSYQFWYEHPLYKISSKSAEYGILGDGNCGHAYWLLLRCGTVQSVPCIAVTF